VSEGLQVAMEAKRALAEAALEGGDELAAKNAAEHLDGKEEDIAWLDPVGAIKRQSAGGHHTMDMGMMLKLLIPGVELAEEAGARWDANLYKNTNLTERLTLQFRAEAFNVLNHTNFNTFLSTRLGSSLFGQICSSRDPRIMQLALKLIF
jgi:hypothetical protein